MIGARRYLNTWSYKVICVNFLDFYDGWWSNSGQYIDGEPIHVRYAGVGGSFINLLSGSTFTCRVCFPEENYLLPVSVNSILETIKFSVWDSFNLTLANLKLRTVAVAFFQITRTFTITESLNIGSHFM